MGHRYERQETAAVGAGYSEHPQAAVAVGEVVGDVLARVDPHPDLAVLFVSGRFVAVLDDVVAAIQALLAPQVLIGADVPVVFDGSDERAGTSGLLLWATHFPVGHGAEQPTVLTFDPSDHEAGWQSPNGTPQTATGVYLVLGQPTAPVSGLAGTVVGLGGSAGTGLVLNGARPQAGAVAVRLPAGAASAFHFTLPRWEDLPTESDPVPDPPPDDYGAVFDPGPGAGILLFAGQQVRGLLGARFDFEMAMERFVGATGGAMAQTVWLPTGSKRPETARRTICGLVFH